jgi:membrane protein implicated in regulation of membrane protease activity
MKPILLAIRSIGAEFANRIYLIVALISGIASIGLLTLSIWLTTFSAWWWLLVVILIIAVSIVIGTLVVVKLIIRSVTPSQSRLQKKQAKEFVDKLHRLSEAAQTPKFILLFQIVRDIAAPREDGFIASISSDTTSLKHDFAALSKTFKE